MTSPITFLSPLVFLLHTLNCENDIVMVYTQLTFHPLQMLQTQTQRRYIAVYYVHTLHYMHTPYITFTSYIANIC